MKPDMDDRLKHLFPDDPPKKEKTSSITQPRYSTGQQIFCLLCLAFIVWKVATYHSPPKTPLDYDYSACSQCRDAILAQLHTPSTADFGRSKLRHDGNGSTEDYVVMGEVDAQNLYGAQVRSYYRCQMLAVPASAENKWNWIVVDSRLLE